jgi:ATP-dependent Clp protease protease subunit
MKLYQKKLVKNFEKVEKDSDRDYWMTSAEAKSYGLLTK